MSFDPVPWFVDGGEHSSAVARLVAYAATSGASGVISSGDLRVTEMPAPTGLVRIYPGACVIPNTYAGVAQQSYLARSASVTDLPVTPTGSGSGRTDLVVVRIDDPEFGGSAPVDPATGPYVAAEIIEDVDPSATDPSAYVDYPAIALARITLPASTATVTDSLITDLRQSAQPRRQRTLKVRQPTATETLNSATFVDWISEADLSVSIPSWATQVNIVATLSGIWIPASSAFGSVRFNLGSGGIVGQEVKWDSEANSRLTVVAAGEHDVPLALRGTTQTLRVQAFRSASEGNPQSQDVSNVIWDIEFLEAPSGE